MKKLIWILILGLVLAGAWIVFQNRWPLGTPATQAAVLYQCPMHPQIIRNAPGNCPICGMKLVLIKKQSDAQSTTQNRIWVSDTQASGMGVRLADVSFKELHSNIFATGTVAYDPELYLAVEEYKQTEKSYAETPAQNLEAQKQMQHMLKSARFKLNRLGLSDAAIDQLKNSNESLLTQSMGKVWVYAEIYQSEISKVRVGQQIIVNLPGESDRKWTGKIDAIDSVLDSETRSFKIRAQISNATGVLRPDMYVELSILVPLGKRLSVPIEAILDTGRSQTAFVRTPQGFETRIVKLGQRGDDALEILSGLKPGEKVAVEANFLLDSESKLKSMLQEHQH